MSVLYWDLRREIEDSNRKWINRYLRKSNYFGRYKSFNDFRDEYEASKKDIKIQISLVERQTIFSNAYEISFLLKDPEIDFNQKKFNNVNFPYPSFDEIENYSPYIGYILRSRYKQYYLGHFLLKNFSDFFKIQNEKKQENEENLSLLEVNFYKKSNNKPFLHYFGEDRVTKNFYRGRFILDKSIGYGKLEKFTYHMEGVFKNSNLSDGEIKYVNHIGNCHMIKKKEKMDSTEKFFEDREPTFEELTLELENGKIFNTEKIEKIGKLIRSETSLKQIDKRIGELGDVKIDLKNKKWKSKYKMFSKEGWIIKMELKNKDKSEKKSESKFKKAMNTLAMVKAMKTRGSNRIMCYEIDIRSKKNRCVSYQIENFLPLSFKKKFEKHKYCKENFFGLERRDENYSSFNKLCFLKKKELLKFGSVSFTNRGYFEYNTSRKVYRKVKNRKKNVKKEEKHENKGFLGKRNFEEFSKNSENEFEEEPDSFYFGGVLDGMRHGKGYFKFSSAKSRKKLKICKNQQRKKLFKSFYKGDYFRNYKHGYGEMQWENGDYYKGDWVLGRMEGKGELRFSNGVVYQGEFKRSEIWGSGSLFPNGVDLSGDVKGLKDVRCEDVKKVEGVWENGRVRVIKLVLSSK